VGQRFLRTREPEEDCELHSGFPFPTSFLSTGRRVCLHTIHNIIRIRPFGYSLISITLRKGVDMKPNACVVLFSVRDRPRAVCASYASDLTRRPSWGTNAWCGALAGNEIAWRCSRKAAMRSTAGVATVLAQSVWIRSFRSRWRGSHTPLVAKARRLLGRRNTRRRRASTSNGFAQNGIR